MQRPNARLAATGAASLAMLSATRSIAQRAPVSRIGSGEYRRQTLQLGSFSKQAALLGQQRASHWQIRQFGAFEADEQTAIAQVLSDEPNPPSNPPRPQPGGMLQNLSMLSGPGFDSASLRGQIMAHQQLLGVQQAFLANTSSGTDLEHIAVLARV